MGDMRCTVKIEFEWQDFKRNVNMNINWTPDSDGVDRRVQEWFSAVTDEVNSRYAEKRWEWEREAREAEQERRDKAEYERLSKKYGLPEVKP